MKNKKIKLFYITASIALTMAFFLVGVYSATNERKPTVTGSISFVASYVWVEYTVKISDAYSESTSNWGGLTWNSLDDENAEGEFGDSQEGKEVQLGDLEISDSARLIAIKITLERKFNKAYYVKVTLPSIQGINFIEAIGMNSSSLSSGLKVESESIDIIIYFEAKEIHSFNEPQQKKVDISVDLSLEQFSQS